MHNQIKVLVHSRDVVQEAGNFAQLRDQPGPAVTGDLDDSSVAIEAAEELNDGSLRALRALTPNGEPQAVVVAIPELFGEMLPFRLTLDHAKVAREGSTTRWSPTSDLRSETHDLRDLSTLIAVNSKPAQSAAQHAR